MRQGVNQAESLPIASPFTYSGDTSLCGVYSYELWWFGNNDKFWMASIVDNILSSSTLEMNIYSDATSLVGSKHWFLIKAFENGVELANTSTAGFQVYFVCDLPDQWMNIDSYGGYAKSSTVYFKAGETLVLEDPAISRDPDVEECWGGLTYSVLDTLISATAVLDITIDSSTGRLEITATQNV